MEEDSRPAPASLDALLTLSTAGAPAELLEFYACQNGLPHWFILYGTWQFLTLEEALELTGILIRSSAHLGEQQWNLAWLPILTDNGGDYCFLDLRQGDLAVYRHTDGERLPLRQSLAAFLGGLVLKLHSGEYVFIDDEPSYTGPRVLGE
ncbi:SMI1/KNR4 family protein [Deinococcus altitudinis]|uniref:SMI1/KNR4 family protein n=1 Tax=Deinococcus altitudinis TaxID=468914 RepID=UPI00389208A4